MNHVLHHLVRAFDNMPHNRKRLLEALSGKVRYGIFPDDLTVAVRTNADETQTYGRFNDHGEFIVFTETERHEFLRKHSAKVLQLPPKHSVALS